MRVVRFLILAWMSAASVAAQDVHPCLVDGTPSAGKVYTRQGYVMGYDEANRIPRWVAYEVKPDFLQGKPPRKGKWASFRSDQETPNPVRDKDYTHSGYARGHLAPWAVMGGDRDGDGAYARDDDPQDAVTLLEANLLSNIAPQHQNGFNGAGGIWFKLERWVQEELVEKAKRDVCVYAGPVVGPGEVEKIGPHKDIAVAALFFKIVVLKPSPDRRTVLAFLMPHHRIGRGEIQHYLVSVDIIEQLTGLDFFNRLPDKQEAVLEAQDTWENWVHVLPNP